MHRTAKLILLGATLFVLPMQTCLAANDELFKKLLDGGMNAIRAKDWKQADWLLSKSLVEAGFKRSLELIGPGGNREQIESVKLNMADCLDKLGKKSVAAEMRKSLPVKKK